MFDAEKIISESIDAAGYSNFNGESWRPGFYRLIKSLNTRPYHDAGQQKIYATIRQALTSRLQIEKWIAEHPEVDEQEIVEPVFIFGLPRTASSALQNVLSVDPMWRFLRGWEAEEPVPPPAFGQEANDPRYLREKTFIEADTTFLGKHIHAPGGPVEDGALARLNFGGQEQSWPVFDYTAWWRDQPKLEMLKYLKRTLKLLQSQRPPYRWMLKTPWYAFCIDELREVFPDAKFVMTHRNPKKIIPSAGSLHFTGFKRFIDKQHLDRIEIGRQALEHWTVGMQLAMDYRRRHPEDDIFDLHHGPFNKDPMGSLRTLYDWLGVTLTPEAEAAMRGWVVANRRGTYGEHNYDTSEYGVSDAEVDEAFADYNSVFGSQTADFSAKLKSADG